MDNKKWYVTKQPNKTHREYDFARTAEQAKGMIKDLRHCNAIAQKTVKNGGNYTIWVKKDSKC